MRFGLLSMVSLAACSGPSSHPSAELAPSAAVAAPGRPGLGFFVTRSRDGSANLGGLAGADALCREAAARGGAGERTWRAYLSAGGGGGPIVHARDRIGRGPWFNARGALIARDVAELHGDLHQIDARTALDERGDRATRQPHDILTGSDQTGSLAYEGGVPATCANWTSDGDGVARIGHDDRMDADSFSNERFRRWNGSWNSEHPTVGCSAKQLADTGGGGGFFCFAADPRPEEIAAARRSAADPVRYTFRRGVIVNHWLGYNLPNADYGAPWFDGEDVAWIADRGFDHVRVWVNGAAWIDRFGHLDETKIGRFDELLRWTRDRRLGVVLAMYGLPGYRTTPENRAWAFGDAGTRADAAYLWWLVARRYADVGGQLRFELLIAPTGASNADELRLFHADVLDGIRRVDRARVVYLSPREGSIDHVDDLFFTDPNLALSVTFIEPEIFTYQFGDPHQLKVTFPGKVPELKGLPPSQVHPPWIAKYAGTEWNEEALGKAVAQLAATASRRAGRHEVYVSRIGVMRGVDDVSARAYLKALRGALEREGLGWAVYDYHTGGAVRGDSGTGAATRIVAGLELSPP